MFRALIVEDEDHGMVNLTNMLTSHCPQIEVVGMAKSNQEASHMILTQKLQIDVAFLDINLSDGFVFQFLDRLTDVDFEIIFVTGYDEHAVKACQYSSIGFVTKPIKQSDLLEAVSRIKKASRSSNQEKQLEIFRGYYNNPNTFKKMSIPTIEGMSFVNVENIERLEAEDNYTHIFLRTGEKITASKTIKSYEEMLSPISFYRVHKKHMINLNFISRFIRGEGGHVVMEGGMKIEVSRRRKTDFLDKVKNLFQSE